MAITKKQVIAKLSVTEARAALEAAIKREQRDIEQRNKAFMALPDYRKRIVIAQDVLDQLATKRIVPRFGVYLEVDDDSVERKFDTYSDSRQSDLKVNEALSGATCQVCGIGSLFVAAVDRANACTVNDMSDINDDDFMRRYLGDWFDDGQLNMIETAFEGRLVSETLDHDDEDLKRSMRFVRGVTTPEGRLKKIMNNIVKNRGVFVP